MSESRFGPDAPELGWGHDILFLHGFPGSGGHFIGRIRGFLRSFHKAIATNTTFLDSPHELPQRQQPLPPLEGEEKESEKGEGEGGEEKAKKEGFREGKAPSNKGGRYRCWWYIDEKDPWNTEGYLDAEKLYGFEESIRKIDEKICEERVPCIFGFSQGGSIAAVYVTLLAMKKHPEKVEVLPAWLSSLVMELKGHMPTVVVVASGYWPNQPDLNKVFELMQGRVDCKIITVMSKSDESVPAEYTKRLEGLCPASSFFLIERGGKHAFPTKKKDVDDILDTLVACLPACFKK
uniref:Serine hydrolase domain-containing protein n=1 Tax=Palpitomonas bilix TaxID=652834 RepID=A0A7S3G3A6_9EUKA|mmetsp:Transcript_18596/g.46870  ORF Transcript_18596/g.46870 Transcript_18596/m.46870 type:complete len:292 (+) Transcript_18596:103-978(+)